MSAALALPPYISPARAVAVEWLTVDEICSKSGITVRSLHRYIASGRTISRQLPVRARNGKHIREILVGSLPQELRTKLVPPAPQVLEMRPARPSQDIAPLFATVAPEQPGRRISLDPKAEHQAAARYAVIEPLLNYGHPANKHKYATCRLTDGRAVKTARLLSEYIAETCTVNGKPVSPATLWRWVKSFREGDKTALARKVNSNKGRSTFFTANPNAALIVAEIYLKPAATVARALDAICRNRELLGLAVDELPSRECVRNYVESMPEAIKAYARDGLRSYNERFAPHLSRDYYDIPANAVWVADTQTHDVEVRNDCFPQIPKDAPLRLNFVCIMDMRSRKIVGYCWCVNGDWRAIATALRRAVERYGPCTTFYCDNGSDFSKVAAGAQRTGKRRKATQQQAEEVATALAQHGPLRQLGIDVTQCIPYNAQAKPIERLFAHVHGRLDALWTGYLTGTPFTRPDAATIIGIEHRKLAKLGRASESMLPPASAFIRIATEWIETDYNALHEHSGRGMDGNTPNHVFDTLYPPQARRTVDREVLDMMLFERDTRTVDAGAIRLTVGGERRRYMPAMSDHDAWATMHLLGEGNVTIAYDALDPDRVIVLHQDGSKACELVPETYASQSPELAEQAGEQIGQMIQIRNRLKKATAAPVKQIDRAVALLGVKSELELIVDRVAAQAPTDLISHKAMPKVRASDTDKAPPYSHDLAAKIMQRKAAK